MYLDDVSFTLRLARLKVEPLRLWLVYAYFFLIIMDLHPLQTELQTDQTF